MIKEINLKVTEAVQDDVNKGIVRVDSNYMSKAGIKPGDIVEIEGERKTVAIIDRSYPGDIGLNIIRMDGVVRRNAKIGIGEIVRLRKAEVKEAKKVIIAPAKKGVVVRAPPNAFKQGLLGRAVLKGDIVSLGGARRRRTTMTGSPFDDIFNNILNDPNIGNFGFGDLKFVVADVNPKQAVIITETTEVNLNPEAIEIEEEMFPDVMYEDIGGLSEEIKKVREMVELPLKHPEIFERLGIEPPKGVLLHGVPGTGKTLLAKAVANETNSHFILINGPEIMSKYYGQSEENIRKKFDEAKEHAPSIIFIDEIDAIATKREETKGEVERRVVAQLLALMDGLKTRGKVVVIAASNIPNALDPALRRPGRFDREIELSVPSKEGRLNILKIHTRGMPLMTSPEAISNSYKKENIVPFFQQLFSLLNYKKLIELIPQKANNIDDGLYELESELRKHVTKIAPKSEKRGVRDFFRLCTPYLSKKLTNIIRENTVFVDGEFKVSKESENALKEKIINLNNIRNIDELILEIVREIILKDIANITHGFVGADLSALAKEAAMIVLRRILPDLRLDEEEAIPKEVLKELRIGKKDFMEALKIVRPSAMREVMVEIPNIKWEDVGGLEEVKQELKEAIEWPLKHPEAFKRLGVKPPKGILLYGAPGTGKTLLAKAVANESEANFILVKGPELLVTWVGESEKAVRKVFKKARQTSPTIICFDEIDSLAPRRGSYLGGSHVTESVVNQLLTEMDGLEELGDVIVIATTNRPDMVDPGLLRPGRFDRIILADIPDVNTRKQIFEVHTKGMPLVDEKVLKENKKLSKQDIVDLDKLVDKTQGYVGADIEAICREAAILTLRKDMKAKNVGMKDFEEALKKVRPSVTKEIENSYKDLQNQFKATKVKQLKDERPTYMG